MSNSQILQSWLDKIATDYKAAAPKASGNTANTTIVEIDAKGGRIRVPYYNYWLIHGRNKNENQSKEGITHFIRWAGYYLFSPWVKQKGLSISPYYVAWKIAKFGYKSKIDLRQIITDQKKTDLLQSLGRNYVTDIKLTINDIWQRT